MTDSEQEERSLKEREEALTRREAALSAREKLLDEKKNDGLWSQVTLSKKLLDRIILVLFALLVVVLAVGIVRAL